MSGVEWGGVVECLICGVWSLVESEERVYSIAIRVLQLTTVLLYCSSTVAAVRLGVGVLCVTKFVNRPDSKCRWRSNRNNCGTAKGATTVAAHKSSYGRKYCFLICLRSQHVLEYSKKFVPFNFFAKLVDVENGISSSGAAATRQQQ